METFFFTPAELLYFLGLYNKCWGDPNRAQGKNKGSIIKDCPAKNPLSGRKFFTGQSSAAYRHDKQMMDICREDACYDTAEYSGTAL